MKSQHNLFRSFRFAAPLFAALGLLASCQKTKPEPADTPENGGMTEVTVRLGMDNDFITMNGTRAFANPATNNVDRVLIVPFAKYTELIDDDNLIGYWLDPAYIEQVDLDTPSFPSKGIDVKIVLPAGKTYQVMAVGFNSADYNYDNPTSPSNSFVINNLTSTSQSLQLLSATFASPTDVPEIFSCSCSASVGGDPFFLSTGQPVTLAGELTRAYAGLSIELTDVPSYVESITLKTASLTHSITLVNRLYNDGIANVVLGTKTPDASGTILFENQLLPRPDTDTTPFTLEVIHSGSASPTLYTVKAQELVPQTVVPLRANEAINLTGDYETVLQTGFFVTTDGGLNLDDNAWDGVSSL